MLKVLWVGGFAAAGYGLVEHFVPSKGWVGVLAGAAVGGIVGYMTVGIVPILEGGPLVGPAGGSIKPPQPSSATPQPGYTDPWGNPWGTTKVTPPPAVQNPIVEPVPQEPVFVTPPPTNDAGLVPWSYAGSTLPMEGADEVVVDVGTYGTGVNQAYGDSWVTNSSGLMIKNSALSSEGYYINLQGYWVDFWKQTNFYFGNAPANPNTYQF